MILTSNTKDKGNINKSRETKPPLKCVLSVEQTGDQELKPTSSWYPGDLIHPELCTLYETVIRLLPSIGFTSILGMLTVRTPLSYFADISCMLAFSGRRIARFWNCDDRSIRCHFIPESSPSSFFSSLLSTPKLMTSPSTSSCKQTWRLRERKPTVRRDKTF